MDGEYNGTEPGTATTKSVTIKIKNLDAAYDTIDLIYLYYGSLTAPPEIFQFAHKGQPFLLPVSGKGQYPLLLQDRPSDFPKTESVLETP